MTSKTPERELIETIIDILENNDISLIDKFQKIHSIADNAVILQTTEIHKDISNQLMNLTSGNESIEEKIKKITEFIKTWAKQLGINENL